MLKIRYSEVTSFSSYLPAYHTGCSIISSGKRDVDVTREGCAKEDKMTEDIKATDHANMY